MLESYRSLRVVFALFTVGALATGCAAETADDDDDLAIEEVDESSAALESSETSAGADRAAHPRRRVIRHLFRALDRADGDRDGKIVIASLPGASPRLVARLTEIDTNGDGAASRDEVRAAIKAHRAE